MGKHGKHMSGHVKFYQIKEQFDMWPNYNKNELNVPKLNLENAHPFEEYLRIVFVRNPFDWLVSLYEYRSKHNPTETPNSFKQFVCLIPQLMPFPPLPGYPHTAKWDLHRFLLDKEGNHVPNFIGRYERLQEDVYEIQDRIGVPREDLPHKQKIDHPPYQTYYDDELKEFVKYFWKIDFELLPWYKEDPFYGKEI
jgi:hypothetical protein